MKKGTLKIECRKFFGWYSDGTDSRDPFGTELLKRSISCNGISISGDFASFLLTNKEEITIYYKEMQNGQFECNFIFDKNTFSFKSYISPSKYTDLRISPLRY